MVPLSSRPTARPWLNDLWPLAKAVWAVAAIAWAVALPGNEPWLVLVFLAALALWSGHLGVFSRRVGILGLGIVLAVAAISFAGSAGGTVYARLFGIPVTTGKVVQFSNTLAQVLSVIGAAVLVSVTTDLEDLSDAFTSVGFSRSVSSGVVGALEALPALRRTIDGVREAQIARGVAADGRVYQRAAAFGSILRPVLLATIEEAADREVTLILRGFEIPGPPTRMKQMRVSLLDRILLVVGLLALLTALTTWLLSR